MTRSASLQRGFAAIAAVFLVVILAGLGAFMLTFSNTQQLTSAQVVQGSRAYWAARAGLGWGIASVTAAPATCPTSPKTLTVEGFAVTVTCNRDTYPEAGATVVIYRLVSRANLGAGATAVERSVSASLEF
jgi:MSHA biogenesis protein MshP